MRVSHAFSVVSYKSRKKGEKFVGSALFFTENCELKAENLSRGLFQGALDKSEAALGLLAQQFFFVGEFGL